MINYKFTSPQPIATKAVTFNNVMPAQETVQNEHRQRPVHNPSILCKLAIGAVDDPLENEADAMADRVMCIHENNFIQRKCSHCEQEEKV